MAALKDILEGKPVRCPLHPAIVHFPIALFTLAALLDLAGLVWSDPGLYLVRSAFIAIAAGVATATLASVFGFVDYTEIRSDHPAKKTATLHMVLNLVAVGIYAVSAGLRYGALDANRTATLPLVLGLVAFGLIGFSGYLGGHLVYNDGIGIGRHRRRTRTPEKTIHVAASGAEGEFVAVGHADDLREGETRRVDVNGTIMVVARTGAEVVAFQEFCTHRYGPLSEGKLQDGEVICPWHCSRFDTRTGAVCDGPAKVPLRTFPVQIRDGKIWVSVSQPAERV